MSNVGHTETLDKICFYYRFMKKSKVFKVWQIILVPVFLFILIHFFKDITQDLLNVATPLDFFGDIKEDLSHFSETFVCFYYWALVNTFFMEIFLIFSIPSAWKRKTFSKLDSLTLFSIFYIIIAFTSATLLDPRY